MKKRYETANQIRDDIDRWKAKAQKLMDSAAALDIVADALFRSGPKWAEHAAFKREQAKKKRRSAGRIMDRKLVHLKDKLSEFMTEPLPGTGATKDIQR